MPTNIGRLKRRADFLRVARSGRKCATRGLVLQMAPTPLDTIVNPPCDLRIGFTVTKRVGNAVIRNRARRRLRAAANQVLQTRAIAGFDYVLIARQSTPTRPYDDLVEDMETAFMRLDPNRSERSSGRDRAGERARK
ncbi:MAG: ribonuclease P protein component [Proteobacteria bacterium]|nr:ribonuclease P protein component [Pseudomonadota bacterium]